MEAMAAHLQTDHKDKLSGKSLSTLLSWSAVQTMGIKTCPFCSDHAPEDTPELVDHVLQEAYEFALRALPWPKPIDHNLNAPPGEFALPDEGGEGNSSSQWINQWIREVLQEQDVVNLALCLCRYDRADHSESINLDEYTDYFDEGGYFDDKHEDKSSVAKSGSSEAEPGYFDESDSFDFNDFFDFSGYPDGKHEDKSSAGSSEVGLGDTASRITYKTGLHILYDSTPDSQQPDVNEIEYVPSTPSKLLR